MSGKKVTVKIDENGWCIKTNMNGIIHREEWKRTTSGSVLVEGSLSDVNSIPKELTDAIYDSFKNLRNISETLAYETN